MVSVEEITKTENISISTNPATDYIEVAGLNIVILSEATIRQNGEANPVINIFDVPGLEVAMSGRFPLSRE